MSPDQHDASERLAAALERGKAEAEAGHVLAGAVLTAVEAAFNEVTSQLATSVEGSAPNRRAQVARKRPSAPTSSTGARCSPRS